MENITAVQEAIENLNQDEKINEGTYLSLMNHLKVLYGKLESQIAPPPRETTGTFGSVFNGTLPADYPYPTYRRVIRLNLPDNTPELNIEATMLHCKYFSVSGELNDFYGIVSATELVDFLRILDVYLTNDDENLITTLADGVEERRNRVEALCRYLFWYEKKFPRGIFKDTTMREKWLHLPYVRKYNIRLAEERKQGFRIPLVVLEGETYEKWSRVFFDIGFHFFNKIKCRWERRNTYTYSERTTEEINKLHKVSIDIKLTETDRFRLHLYTDKIQLGRSPIVQGMYRMGLILSLFYNINAPIEKYLLRMSEEMMYNRFPTLKTSGITAKTRNKARTYEVGDEDWTITYKSKMNDVDEGTE
jgi:hypothetical protein